MPTDPISLLNAALRGRYHVERQLGEGGMATVYLAGDIKHERKVALKVLKPELAAVVGVERFLTEIKTTANLQHPHILPLYDSGEADGIVFYTMPFIEGESLRDRLDREKQLPVGDAVQITKDVAEALQAAHEQGVVHRDIKPANILLSRGKPIVADFGIALAVSTAGGGRLTETGLSLGTPHYMSPEQATGDQVVGSATDTYALGCVLYEMLIGEPPYTGSTAQAVLGKIITHEPTSAIEHRKTVPPHVDAAILRALEKLPADRFRDAAGFIRALDDPTFRHGLRRSPEVRGGTGWWRVAAVGFAVTTMLFAGLWRSATRAPTAAPSGAPETFEAPFRTGQEPTNAAPGSFALSPDGSLLVYQGPGEPGATPLWVRRWDDPQATVLPGSDGGRYPSLSADNEMVAFTQGGSIHVLPLEGGPVTTWIDGEAPIWGDDGALYATRSGGVVRIDAPGREPSTLSTPPEGGRLALTSVLAGSSRGLVTLNRPNVPSEVHLLDFGSGEMTRVVAGERGQYVESGFLTFMLDDQLMAARFDPESGEVGPPEVIYSGLWGAAISASGSLFYATSFSRGPHIPVRVDRSGRFSPIDPGWEVDGSSNNTTLALSPDGDRLIVADHDAVSFDLWLFDLRTGTRSRLTTSEFYEARPSWHPSGLSVLFNSGEGGPEDELWEISVDGGSAQPRVRHPGSGARQGEYTPSGDHIVYRAATSTTGGDPDLFIIDPDTDSVGTVVVDEPYTEWDPAVSPDGEWLAYASDRSGRLEVYVTSLRDPRPGGSPVSLNGGREPRWARDTSTLFYRTGQTFESVGQELVAAEYDIVGGRFTVVDREPLFVADAYLSAPGVHKYDVSPDGQTFYMFRSVSGAAFKRTRLVQHLDRELERRLDR